MLIYLRLTSLGLIILWLAVMVSDRDRDETRNKHDDGLERDWLSSNYF